MVNKSLWNDYKDSLKCKTLSTNINVDVLIIGGGMTGVSTAYQLINSGLDVCVVERNTIGSGVTNKTTGKISYLQEDIYSKLEKFHNIETAKNYLDSQKYAISILKEIINKHNIKCDLKQSPSYIVNNNTHKYNNERNILKKLGVNIKESNYLPNGNKAQTFFVEDTYVFHPLKYLYSLKEICLNSNIKIYENTSIVSIEKEKTHYICKTENNKIKTKYVVLALHYPYFLFPFLMPFKSYIEKSYIKATKIKQNYKFNSITISKPTISTRYHIVDDNVHELYLANSHNTCSKNNDCEHFKSLVNTHKTKPDYIWSNKDIITIDSLPFIGPLNAEQTLLIGTGYNTWGMTNSSLAGKIISDIILNKPNIYQKLFNPLRKWSLNTIIKFPLILGSNSYSFIKSKISVDKSWYSKNIRFEKRNGKNIAIYTDKDGTEHTVYNTCPHMKCGLIFNELEKTWDCPCHGSRFTIDGVIIEGPSNFNITYKE